MDSARDDAPVSSDRTQIGGEIRERRRFVHSDEEPQREMTSVVYGVQTLTETVAIKQRPHHGSPLPPTVSSSQPRTRPARHPSGPSRTASPMESPEKSGGVPITRHASQRSASSPSGRSRSRSPTSCGRSLGANASVEDPSQTFGSTSTTSQRSGDSPGELRAEIIASTRTTRSRYGQSLDARRSASPTTRRRETRTSRTSPSATNDLIGHPFAKPPVLGEACTSKERPRSRDRRRRAAKRDGGPRSSITPRRRSTTYDRDGVVAKTPLTPTRPVTTLYPRRSDLVGKDFNHALDACALAT
jgi:hypothetical protein